MRQVLDRLYDSVGILAAVYFLQLITYLPQQMKMG